MMVAREISCATSSLHGHNVTNSLADLSFIGAVPATVSRHTKAGLLKRMTRTLIGEGIGLT
jgi:hypothetical protein